ncbi:MAG: hypothetical protein Kow0077_23950 [Anaerolineae bacterium]
MEKRPIRYRRILIALLALVIVMAGLITLIRILPMMPGTFDQAQAQNTMENMTRVETFVYTVEPRHKATSLRILLSLESGAAAWIFTDPEGAVRWEGRLDGPGIVDQMRGFPPITGIWRMQLMLDDATGDYTVTWRGNN